MGTGKVRPSGWKHQGRVLASGNWSPPHREGKASQVADMSPLARLGPR